MNEYLKEILWNMCKRVDMSKKKFGSFDFRKPSWFHQYSWTEEEEEDFKQWLIRYLREHEEARYDLLRIFSSDKRFLQKVANEFAMNYGWKIKE